MSNYIKVLPAASEGWTRPTEWLPIPSYTVNEEVFYGLHAVWDTSANPCALLCNGTGAGYTVDWGDGTVTDYAFNVKAERNYNYASLSGTPFRGYRQALVKVTPRAGATITTLNLNQRHSSFNYIYGCGWLEVISNYSNVTYIGINEFTIFAPYVERYYLKNINNSLLQFNAFHNSKRLQVVEVKTWSVTSIASSFRDCPALHTIIVPEMSNVTNINNAFANTPNIELSEYEFSNVQGTTNQAFVGVLFKGGIPVINTNLITSLEFGLFFGWTHTYIPSLNCTNVTAMNNWLFNVPNYSIRRSLIFGAKVTHSYVNQLLGATALNEIFTNLGTANSGASITITGNTGAATCNQSIATAKGWTVIN